MRHSEAIRAILTLLQNCELASDRDFSAASDHAFYSTVALVDAYPLADQSIPCLALSNAGGSNLRKGLGDADQWHQPRVQMDALASTALEARRIYEKVAEILRYDYNGDGAGAAGSYGKHYLRDQGVKDVELGEPRQAVWDEEGRVARLVADAVLTFED